jgi:Tfp pilus assembly protein PilF
MKRPRTSKAKATDREREFYAEAEYADSMLRDALGDREGTVSALRWSLELKPTYAPAILSMGSVEYQLGRRAQGRKLFRSLLSLPENTPDLCQTIDEAGSFLIQIGAYKDGLELFRAAIEVFPAAAVLHQGVGCCAGHEGYHEEAVAASERALQLEPGNQKFVNDLGWCLFEAGRLEEAGRILSERSPWTHRMSWRERTFASTSRSSRGGRRGATLHETFQAAPRNRPHLSVAVIRPTETNCEVKRRKGGRRTLPYAFTEQGVAMLSTVLNCATGGTVRGSICFA